MIATVDERRLTMPEELPPQTRVSVDAAGAGRWLVTELKPDSGATKPTREQVLQAIAASTWQPTASWEEIRSASRAVDRFRTYFPTVKLICPN